MNSVPRDLQALVSFFHLPLPETPSSGFGSTVARIHALTLLSMNYLQTSIFEDHLLNGNRFLEGYLQVMGHKEIHQEDPFSSDSLADFVQVTLGPQYEYTTDSLQIVKIYLQNKTYDLFPFLLSKSNGKWWFHSARPGILSYVNAAEEILQVDCNHPFFEELLSGFLDRGWYRIALRTLEGLPEQRQKQYENKAYSAHCFLGCDHYKMRHYNDAVQEFEKAMQIKSNMPQLYYNLALSYARLKS
jgi:hypothetical protein